jgi:Fe-S-cluster containining protein
MKKLKVLPTMRCDQGCGDCCGIAPATEAEYRKVMWVAKQKGIVPLRQGHTCPFYQHDTCQVYDARPLACRLFGHVVGMECSRGYNTNIDPQDANRLIRANGMPNRVLHEALIDAGIVKTLEEAVTQEVP